MHSESSASESSSPVTSPQSAGRPQTLLNSPRALLQLMCATTAALWVALLAITFTDKTPLIAVATGVWLLVASVTLLLTVFLSRRRSGANTAAVAPETIQAERSRLVLIPVLWIVVALIVSNLLVGHWQSQQRLWSGFVFNSRYGWYPEPNLIKRELTTPHGSYRASTDNLGHRNLLPYPASRKLPIVVQGDSNTFGFGLNDDETLASVLNSRLPTPQVFNLGIPGFDLNQYFYQYSALSDRFQMGTRIIHWNIGNDFTLSALETPNYFRRPYLYVDKGQVIEAADFVAPLPVQGYGQSFVPPFRSQDGLIRAPEYDWADIYPEALIRLPLSRQLIRTYHPKLVQTLARVRSRPASLELYNPSWMLLKRDLWPQPYAQYAKDFPLLLRALKKQNPRLVLCPFPFREQVIPSEYAAQTDKLLALGYGPEDLDPLAFNTFLKTTCYIEKIDLIDPTSKFLATEDPSRLYQTGDQHLSAAGMVICAEALLEAGVGSHAP